MAACSSHCVGAVHRAGHKSRAGACRFVPQFASQSVSVFQEPPEPKSVGSLGDLRAA